MRRNWIMAVAASAALGLGAAELNAQGASASARGQAGARQSAQARDASQAAQQRAREAERQRAERQRAAERDRERARAARDRIDILGSSRQQARGGAPAFCRNGQGHPVHGRQWCVQKGFGLGTERWDRVGGWGDIIFGQPRDRRRYDDGAIMSRGVLGDILGDVVLGRFEGYGRQHGNGAVTGSWLPGVDGRILQLSMGGVPFAQLVDERGRGRADAILIRRR